MSPDPSFTVILDIGEYSIMPTTATAVRRTGWRWRDCTIQTLLVGHVYGKTIGNEIGMDESLPYLARALSA